MPAHSLRVDGATHASSAAKPKLRLVDRRMGVARRQDVTAAAGVPCGWHRQPKGSKGLPLLPLRQSPVRGRVIIKAGEGEGGGV